MPLIAPARARGPLHHAAHGPPPRAGEDQEWLEAAAAFGAARAAVRAEEERTAGWPYAAAKAREAAYGALLDSMQSALRRLLAAPAPDLGALALKIELAIAHEVWELSGGAACGAAILGDARRLAGAEACPHPPAASRRAPPSPL